MVLQVKMSKLCKVPVCFCICIQNEMKCTVFRVTTYFLFKVYSFDLRSSDGATYFKFAGSTNMYWLLIREWEWEEQEIQC